MICLKWLGPINIGFFFSAKKFVAANALKIFLVKFFSLLIIFLALLIEFKFKYKIFLIKFKNIYVFFFFTSVLVFFKIFEKFCISTITS